MSNIKDNYIKKIFYSVAVFVGYTAAAQIGLAVHAVHGIAAAVWPPTGVAMAAVLLGGNSMAASVFVASAYINLQIGRSPFVAASIALVSALEALMAGWAFKQIKAFDWCFGQVQQVIRFLAYVVFGSTLVSAIADIAILKFAGLIDSHNLINLALNWWIGDGLGALTLLPFVMIWAKRPLKFPFPAQNWEFFTLVCLSIVTCTYALVSLDIWTDAQLTAVKPIYLLFPFIIWSALRFGSIGTASIMLVISAFATYGATQQFGSLETPPLPGSLAAVQAFIAISTITGLLMAAAITESKFNENRFRSMFEAVGTAMVKVDVEAKFILVNDYFCELTGYSREELIGMSFPEITHPDDIEREAVIFEKIRSGIVNKVQLEKRYLRKNGDVIWISVDATMMPSPTFGKPNFMAVVQDITQRKSAELESQKAMKLADEANRAKSAFLASMSHEIRTPLGVILGFSELLKDPKLVPELRTEFTETVHRNAIELGGLIDEILDLSKVEAGKFDLLNETIDLDVLLNDIGETFTVSAQSKGLHLQIKKDKDVPREIISDHKRLRQIIVNIVGNAIKYSDSGTITLRAFMPPRGPGEKIAVAFSVKDDGRGISEDDAAILFQPFTRGNSKPNGRSVRGTGLGLALSRALSKLLGGDVQLITSKIDGGSTFLITIDPGPLSDKPNANNTTLADLDRSDAIGSRLRRLDGFRILVAEDTPDQAILIRYMLTNLGATIETVDNGSLAFDQAMTDAFDIVLMDMQMPILDGYGATNKLRKSGYKKPIIALTAQAMTDDAKKCKMAGCSDHLPKPFTQDALRDAIMTAQLTIDGTW